MERRRRVVVVNLVRFVRDLQKHVTRTVHRVSGKQSTGRRGWFVHRGAFFRDLFFLVRLSLSLSLYIRIFSSFELVSRRLRERFKKRDRGFY